LLHDCSVGRGALTFQRRPRVVMATRWPCVIRIF
jgi:hypothetical protein